MACEITGVYPGDSSDKPAAWGTPVNVIGTFADDPNVPLPPSGVKVHLVDKNQAPTELAVTPLSVTAGSIQAQLPAEDLGAAPYAIKVSKANGDTAARTIHISAVGATLPAGGSLVSSATVVPAGQWVDLTLQTASPRTAGGGVVGGRVPHRVTGGVRMASPAAFDPSLPVKVFENGRELKQAQGEAVPGDYAVQRVTDKHLKLLLSPGFTDYPANNGSPFSQAPRSYEIKVSVGNGIELSTSLLQLPIELPQVAVLARHPSFQTKDFGTFIFLVSADSSFVEVPEAGVTPLQYLEKVLETIQSLKASGLVGFLGWVAGLNRLVTSIKNATVSPAVRYDAVHNLHDVLFRKESFIFDGWKEDITGEDRVSSVAYIGCGGAVNLFNRRNLETEWRWMQLGVRRPGIVLVDRLTWPVDGSSDSGPTTPDDPTNTWIVFDQHDPNNDGFDDIFGSVALTRDVEALNPVPA